MRLVFVWVLLSAAAAIIAGLKGRSPLTYFLLAVFLSPPVGILAAVLMPQKRLHAQASAVTRTCPHCQSEAEISMDGCPNCASPLPPIIDADGSAENSK